MANLSVCGTARRSDRPGHRRTAVREGETCGGRPANAGGLRLLQAGPGLP